MRAIISVFLLLALALTGWAQDDPTPGEPAPKEGEPEKKADEEKPPEEPPAWKLADRERKKVARFVEDYVHPGRKTRQDILEKFQKFVDKEVDGHSVIEDVAAWVDIANQQRVFNSKLGKKGKVVTVDIKPDWHGFPGGIGTVTYAMYVPKKYDARRLWPVIYCLPDNKQWPDKAKYIQEMWVTRSAAVAEGYIIVAPNPQAKGESWAREKSLARAMITLRHVMGTFEANKKSGGPASDMTRIFLDGSEEAATIAARFAELFTGVILHDCDGRDGGGPDLAKFQGLHGLPAYSIYKAKSKRQRRFAQKLKAANDASLFVEAENDKMLGDGKAIADWMAKLPPRNTQPRTLDYTIHEPSFQRHYWLTVLEYDASAEPIPMISAVADRAKNEVRIDINGVTRFELFLNDAIVDLNREVRIVVTEGDKEYDAFKGMRVRDLGVLLGELVVSNHPWRVYPSMFLVDVPQLRAIQAEKDAAAAAKKKAEEEAKKGDASKENSGTKNPMKKK